MKCSTRPHRVFPKPQFEMLERRTLFSTFTVTNASDSGTGSLRAEIMLANTATSSSNHPTIKFNIPVVHGTVAVIAPKSALPAVAKNITIDGSTEPNGVTGVPRVAIGGLSAGSASGLSVTGSDTINGLTILFFKKNGIVVSGGGHTTISNDVMELNGKDGLQVASQNNTIENNKVGTDVYGKTAEANGNNGIEVMASHNTLSGNLVSGNTGVGILLDPKASNTLLVKNFIGTNATGKTAIGNKAQSPASGFGALTIESNDNTIGRTGQGNLISGNTEDGIAIQDPSDAMGNIIGGDITGNVIQGNTIGTDITGEVAIPNAVNGIDFDNVPSVDDTTISENLISGNHGAGIEFVTVDNARITSNIIGADRKILKPLGNGAWGIDQEGNAKNLTIGGVGLGNHICSNKTDGILIAGPGGFSSSGETIERNFIGVGANGMALGNGGDGVEVDFIGGNAILTNSIYNNAGLGIELAGGNNSQPAPVLTSAGSPGIKGTVKSGSHSHSAIKYTIQFFSSPKLSAGGHAQGKTYLGQITVSTNSAGMASFTANFTVKEGQIISATATDPNGNTSEFSNGLLAH
jgi:parallel beta-helix repeat protein